MEIEKKFLVDVFNFNLENFEQKEIEQSYISINPVIRLRKSNQDYILTVKGPGRIMREEFELKISENEYTNLKRKVEGHTIFKTRYIIPLDSEHIAELDLYHGELEGLRTVEVEFKSLEELNAFVPPDWFGKDVSNDSKYSNSTLSLGDTNFGVFQK